jgi:phage major head subunit gpT-like protein
MAIGQYGILDNKNLIDIWEQEYEPALNAQWSSEVGTKVDSTMETESYGWLGAAPSMELMTADQAVEEQFEKYLYFLKNQEYAKTLKIAEKDMRRDKLGMIQLRIGEMAEKAAEHWNTLTCSTLVANPLCFDGSNLFSSSHVAGGLPAQINDLTNSQIPALATVSSTAPTPLEAATALNAVLGSFYSFVDDKGDPANGQAKEFMVLCGTTNIWAPMNAACTMLTFAQGAQNPIIGALQGQGIKVKALLIPRLSSLTTQFIVMRTDGKVKALVLQEEVPVQPNTSSRDNDEFIKFRRFLFSVYTSRAVGVLRWQSAIRATLS